MAVRFHFRLYLLAILVIVAFAVLIHNLWNMQINDLQKYRDKIPGHRELVQRLPGVRGEIKDRNGQVLVTNKVSHEVIFDLRDIASSYRKSYGSIPRTSVSYTNSIGQKRTLSEPDIVKVVNETVVAGLEELGLAVPYSKSSLQVHYRSNPVVPWTYRRGLEFDEFARFAEHDLGLPGVSPTVRPIRHYVYDSLASHILGYVKLPEDGAAPAEEREKWDFYVGDDYGVRGVEKTRNGDLRGQPGTRTLLKNEKGVIVGEVPGGQVASSPGSDIYLTIDVKMQYLAEQALRQANVGRGAAVVIDPANGDILAMAAVPSFNPNQFIPHISREDWKLIDENPTKPLMNKAVLPFPPGSIYKIPVALGGCLADIESRSFHCSGGVTYGRKFKRCWIHNLGGAHGSIGLSEAIMRSCNCYFYQYGNVARIDNIVTAGKLVGLGSRTGIDLDVESPGILPGRKWLQQVRPGRSWTSADTANVAIGQGDVLATPLQMAAVTAAVANGGTFHTPCIVDRIIDPRTGRETKRARRPPRDLASEGIDAAAIRRIRKGMLDVVNADRGGTGKSARIEGVKVAGKTGTAEAWRNDPKLGRIKDLKTWFISFAPYDEPTLAVCVLVEGGKSGGSTAAPISRRIIEQSLALHGGSSNIRPRPLVSASGHFRNLEKVEYGDTALASLEDGPAYADETELVSFEPVNEDSEPVVPRAIPVPPESAEATPSFRPTAEDEDASIPRAVPLPRARPLPQ